MKIGQGVFELQGSKNRGLPLSWPVALTTVQHYRADCWLWETCCEFKKKTYKTYFTSMAITGIYVSVL